MSLRGRPTQRGIVSEQRAEAARLWNFLAGSCVWSWLLWGALVSGAVGCAQTPQPVSNDSESSASEPERDPEEERRVAQVRAHFREIEVAALLFKLDFGNYPARLEQLWKGLGETGYPYLTETLHDPWSGKPYQYLVAESGFSLISLGADQREGGEGYASDLVGGVRDSDSGDWKQGTGGDREIND